MCRPGRSFGPGGDLPGAASMKAVLRLIYTYFTCTPAQKVFSAVGAVLIVGSGVLLVSVAQSWFLGVLAFIGIASLFIGSSMMPLMFGRLARSHMSRTLPGARLKLLAGALITLLIVSTPVPLLAVFGLMTASGPRVAHLTAAQI